MLPTTDAMGHVGGASYTQNVQRKAGFSRILFAALAVLAVFGVAIFVGLTVFKNTVNSNMSLGDPEASSALVAVQEGEPFYALMVAELGSHQGYTGARTNAYQLVRVDPATGALFFISIPANLLVTLPDGQSHQLWEAEEYGGDAQLISSVSLYADVPISHIARIDQDGLDVIVKFLGGVSMTLEEEIDDPQAGDIYIPAGDQTLDAAMSRVFLRATNLTNGLDAQALNRANYTLQVVRGLTAASSGKISMTMDALGGAIKTDMDIKSIERLWSSLSANVGSSVEAVMMPGRESEVEGRVVFIGDTSALAKTIAQAEGGEASNQSSSAPVNVDKATFTVEVRNGAGIEGGATNLAETLKSAGYEIGEVGNVEDYTTYPETLIVYKENEFANAANMVNQTLGAGRVIASNGYYDFEGDVLVILGADWAPES